MECEGRNLDGKYHQKNSSYFCVLFIFVLVRNSILQSEGDAGYFDMYLDLRRGGGNRVLTIIYSDTSANEDNSFRNHIR